MKNQISGTLTLFKSQELLNFMSSIDQLEEKIEKPGYLLFVLAIWMLMVIGFVNVISHQSDPPTIFGMYSVRYFAVIVVYLIVIIGWTLLFFRPNQDAWFSFLWTWIISRWWAVVGILAVLAVVNYFTFTFWRSLSFPAVQGVIIILSLIFIGMLLFYPYPEKLWWRRILIPTIAGLIVVELVIQLAAAAGLIPSLNDPRNAFSPYDRIYYKTDEVLQNHMANRYGWNVPEFRLEDGSYRIMLMGDEKLQGLAVAPQENLGAQLDQMLQESRVLGEENTTEVLTFGHPDYGPGVYTNVPLYLNPEAFYSPSEVIVFFDFNNDFQILSQPDGRDIFFYEENGELALDWDNSYMRHLYLHEALWGLDGPQPIRSIRSHYLTPKVLRELLASEVSASSTTVSAPQTDVALPNSFVFYEDLNDRAMWIAKEHLELMADHLATQGTTMRLVTIPVFSEGFYTQGDTAEWTTAFGEADLFLPERELRTFAADKGISFLGLGEYLANSGLTASEIQALFYDHGHGQFTPSGHDLAAEAVYNCFFGQTVGEGAGCDLR